MQDIKKGRIRYLEQELKARGKINSLKAGNNNRKNED